MRDRGDTARRGEAAAADHLAHLGMRLLETNWRCSIGEIDIVAVDCETLVVAEVRTRRSHRFGSPEDSISIRKQRKLVALADAYVSMRRWPGAWRIDVVAVMLNPDDSVDRVTHYPGAIGG
jgi:putative endonuclease